jgi:hypothetical protein
MSYLSDRTKMIMWAKKVDREGVALEIIKICKEVAQEEHYKNAVIACGRLHAIALGCSFDSYWQEKKDIGFANQVDKAEVELSK